MTTNKKLNTFFNIIGNNAIKNEETSIGIVEELTIQNLANNLKSNGSDVIAVESKAKIGMFSYKKEKDQVVKNIHEINNHHEGGDYEWKKVSNS